MPRKISSRARLGIALALGLVLATLAGAYAYFWHARPVGQGPAGPAVSREAFSAPWTTREVLVVGLGDSITAGFGARPGYGYFDRLVTNPPDESADMRGICLTAVLPHLTFTNLAVSGSTSLQHAERQLPHLPVTASNVLGLVVITSGGNDLIHNYGRTPPRDQAMFGADWEQAQPWIASFSNRLDSMIHEIRGRFPGGCHIFLANIYDPTDGTGDIERAGLPAWPDGKKILQSYNDIIRNCTDAHEDVHLVDLRALFLGHGLHCTQFWAKHYDAADPRYWYSENIEDPNERGYDAIRRLFLIEMAGRAKQL